MSKKIEFFSSDEQSGTGNQTRRVSPLQTPPVETQSVPQEGGNVTRRVAPPADDMMTPKPMDDTTAAPQEPAAAGPRPTHTRVLGRVADAAPDVDVLPTVGWLVIMEGPGRGSSHVLEPGMSQIGRASTNRVCLNYGDTSISRENHAFVAYDEESRTFYIGHGGKANLVRLNEKVVLSEMEMQHGDFIRIGETALRFIAFCGPHFDWADLEGEEAEEAMTPQAEMSEPEPMEDDLPEPAEMSEMAEDYLEQGEAEAEPELEPEPEPDSGFDEPEVEDAFDAAEAASEDSDRPVSDPFGQISQPPRDEDR